MIFPYEFKEPRDPTPQQIKGLVARGVLREKFWGFIQLSSFGPRNTSYGVKEPPIFIVFFFYLSESHVFSGIYRGCNITPLKKTGDFSPFL